MAFHNVLQKQFLENRKLLTASKICIAIAGVVVLVPSSFLFISHLTNFCSLLCSCMYACLYVFHFDFEKEPAIGAKHKASNYYLNN